MLRDFEQKSENKQNEEIFLVRNFQNDKFIKTCEESLESRKSCW